jgi:diadenosine tetraphosphatase ApaH/serine/threonine PP2A family protein phosphatase
MIADFDELVAGGSLDPATGIGKMVAWTRDKLGDELVNYLGSLPPSITINSESGAGRLMIFHGTPRSDEEGLIEGDNDERMIVLTESAQAYAIVGGHTHKSFARMVRGTLIANAGSVGRSYEGHPGRATYLALDDERGVWMVEVRHVRYDRRRNYRALVEEGVPIDHDLAEPFNTAIPPV